jgi:hypothetical protein
MLRWLGWLAEEMKARNQTEFAFGEMDFVWLRLRHGPIGSLAVSQATGLLASIIVGGLAGGIGFGLLVGFSTLVSTTIHQTVFSFLAMRRRLRVVEILSMLFGPVLNYIVFGATGSVFRGMAYGHLLGLAALAASLVNNLLFQVARMLLFGRSLVDRRSLRSWRFAMVVLLASASTLALSAAVAQTESWWRQVARLAIPLPVIWAVTSLGLNVGLSYAIHLAHWLRGFVPLRYTRFLNEAVDRLFLIRRGTAYEFLHLTLRDYMAERHGSR